MEEKSCLTGIETLAENSPITTPECNVQPPPVLPVNLLEEATNLIIQPQLSQPPQPVSSPLKY